MRVAGPVRGEVTAPPSKSLTQRALIAAALARGRSRISNPLLSDDSRHLIAALGAVGIPARVLEAAPRREAVVEVDGRGGEIPAESAQLRVGNAGTTMRFLTALLALGRGSYLIDGDRRMRERPIGALLEALRSLGAAAESVHRDGCPPVRVGGRGIPGGRARLSGSTSSQFLSGLLLAAPASATGVSVEIAGEVVSRPYVDLTIGMMRRFGVEVACRPPGPAARRFGVEAGQRYLARELRIEGDYSSASYFFAAAAVTGGSVTVRDLDPGSGQGDARFLDLLREMGCRVHRGRDRVTLEAGAALRGIDADLGAMPDVAPTLAVVALFADGATRIRGVPHLRLKETDRIGAVVGEIRRLGGEARPERDGLLIEPRPLSPARIETYGDHRMAMAFAIAGLRIPGVSIADPGCVAKSFPAFWSVLDDLTRA
ncbi:MAG: 3-phosphoshikimate 1-carboxyvinyltransferase [Acidobacteriota bacterium]